MTICHRAANPEGQTGRTAIAAFCPVRTTTGHRRISLCLLLAFSSTGCFLQKKTVAPVPAAPIPVATAPIAPPTVTPAPQPVSPAPQPVETLKPSPFPASIPATNPPKPAAATPRPVPVAPTLGAILSADQRKQLDTAYQADLAKANTVLNSLNGRALTPAQTDTVNRARASLKQAAEFHDRDLTTAAELARRARVLTQELASALR